jgi:serine/threonine protein kinase
MSTRGDSRSSVFVTRDDAIGTVSTDAASGDRVVIEGPPDVAGYEILRMLGAGGMGAVYEAIELRFDRRVALKVHKRKLDVGSQSPDNELWTEAFLAAKIVDPGIVRVHDVGFTLAEEPYYTMDLVDGSELSTLINEGPLPARRAMEIALDVARALAVAHEAGVVHCDLKPRNVLIDLSGHARVLDFGIAHNARTGMRRFVGIFGTPSHMAPEQALGLPVGPATDVHGVGILLYEMLTGGQRPYGGLGAEEVVHNVGHTRPVPVRERLASIPAPIAEVVDRCLAKGPGDRFASGRALLEALQAVVEGRSLADLLEASPAGGRSPTARPPAARLVADKPRREDAKKHFSWSWTLRSPPEKLWPLVANTDRFNRAIGLAEVDFVDTAQSDGSPLRIGKMRTLGLNIEWREYPFEWVREREHSVFRSYRAGPISALWNRVRMVPTADGGTELTHELWLMPRGIFGSVAAFVEIGSKMRRNVDRIYRHLDEALVANLAEDPFEGAYVPTPDQRALANDAFRRLQGEGFDRVLLEKLASYLLAAPSQVLAAMRPYALADAWNVDRAALFELFLHAAHLGVLTIAWDVICPKCLVAHESVGGLAGVTRLGTCEACVNTYERDLSASVELIFRPDARIRETERVTYCVGAPALRPHVVMQQVLEPGETRTVPVRLDQGVYRVVAAQASTDGDLVASAVGYESRVAVVIRAAGASEGVAVVARPAYVLAGDLDLTFRNETDLEQTVRVEHAEGRADRVAAVRAITHPTFRDFFGDELIGHGEHLNVSRITFLFLEAEERARVFAGLGDVRACELFEELDAIFRAQLEAEEGTDVAAPLGLSIAAFSHPQRAVQAAIGILRNARKKRVADEGAVRVRLAVHEGRCLALTRGARVEYFGETLHRGVSLLEDSRPGALAISASVASDRRVASRIHAASLVSSIIESTHGPYQGRRVMLASLPE